MFLAHKLIATKILLTGAVVFTAGTVLAAAALSDPNRVRLTGVRQGA